MSDVTCFWIAFACYLVAMLVLATAALLRGGEGLARWGRALVWLGLGAQTLSIAWRGLLLGSEPIQAFLGGLSRAFSSGPAWRAAVYTLIFGLAAGALAVGVAFRRRRIVWLLVAGVAVILELIFLDFLDFARMPIEKVYEYLSLASWCAALGLLALSPLLRSVVLDAALALAACLLVVFAAVQTKTMELHMMPALQSYWLFIHVSVTSLGYAIFGIAFVLAALFLVRSFDAEGLEPGTRRRAWLAAGVALVVGTGVVLALVLGGLVLPFEAVAYDPHQLQEPQRPAVGLVQAVRYGAALLGAGCAVAYLVYWIALRLLRPREARAGFASYLFVLSVFALFVACLVLGGVVARQEAAIGRLRDEHQELGRLVRERESTGGRLLTDEELNAGIARLRALAAQARDVLRRARWLPLGLEDQAAVAGDPVYQSLVALYREAGAEWKLPIRYKDIKEIGRRVRDQAGLLEALAPRLSLPADREGLERARRALAEEFYSLQAAALLPRGKDGAMAAFAGLACLIAVPVGVGLHWLARRLRAVLPEAKRLDTLSYVAIAVGYPLFTFGALFAGAIWAHFAWGSWWSWDPKEVGSLVGWVLYTIYLHQRYREGLSPRAAAVAGMLGFLAATLSLAGNAFLGGLHAYS